MIIRKSSSPVPELAALLFEHFLRDPEAITGPLSDVFSLAAIARAVRQVLPRYEASLAHLENACTEASFPALTDVRDKCRHHVEAMRGWLASNDRTVAGSDLGEEPVCISSAATKNMPNEAVEQ